MAFLQPDLITKIHYPDKDLVIKRKVIPDQARATKDVSSWCKKGQRMKPCAPLSGTGRPRGICVHNSNEISAPNTTQSEQYTRATWPNCNMGGVVVNYYVCSVEAWQNLEDNEQGWHATDGSSRTSAHPGASYTTVGGNLDTISVEVIGKSAEDNAARLVAYLLLKHDLKIKDVYTHNYFISYAKYGRAPSDDYIQGSYKNCPIYILDHWSQFLENVEKYYNILKPLLKNPLPTINPPASSINNINNINNNVDPTLKNVEPQKTMYKVQVGAFTTEAYAITFRDKAVKAGFKDSYYTSYTYNDDKNKKLFRVQIGAFSSKENAEAFVKKAKSKGFDAFILKC